MSEDGRSSSGSRVGHYPLNHTLVDVPSGAPRRSGSSSGRYSRPGSAGSGGSQTSKPMPFTQARPSSSRQSMDEPHEPVSESSSGLRHAMRQARHMFPFRRTLPSDESDSGHNYERTSQRHASSSSSHTGTVSYASETLELPPLQRNDSNTSHHSRTSSGASGHTTPSRTGSLQRNIRPYPVQEIPEPANSSSVEAVAPGPASTAPTTITPFSIPPPPPPPPPSEAVPDKRTLFLRARTKSIDHMHRFLNLRNLAKEGKEKMKGKKKKQETAAMIPTSAAPDASTTSMEISPPVQRDRADSNASLTLPAMSALQEERGVVSPSADESVTADLDPVSSAEPPLSSQILSSGTGVHASPGLHPTAPSPLTLRNGPGTNGGAPMTPLSISPAGSLVSGLSTLPMTSTDVSTPPTSSSAPLVLDEADTSLSKQLPSVPASLSVSSSSSSSPSLTSAPGSPSTSPPVPATAETDAPPKGEAGPFLSPSTSTAGVVAAASPAHSPMKAVSSAYSITSADTQNSLTSLATANEMVSDSLSASPERVRRRRSRSLQGDVSATSAWSLPRGPSVAEDVAQEADEGETVVHATSASEPAATETDGFSATAADGRLETPMDGSTPLRSTPTHGMASQMESMGLHSDTVAVLMQDDMLIDPNWEAWHSSAQPTPTLERGAQDLLDNLGLDDLEVGTHTHSPVLPSPVEETHGDDAGIVHGVTTDMSVMIVPSATSPASKHLRTDSPHRQPLSNDGIFSVTSAPPMSSRTPPPPPSLTEHGNQEAVMPLSTSASTSPTKTQGSGGPRTSSLRGTQRSPSPTPKGPKAALSMVPGRTPSPKLPVPMAHTCSAPAAENSGHTDGIEITSLADTRTRPINRILEPLNIRALASTTTSTSSTLTSDLEPDSAPATLPTPWSMRFRSKGTETQDLSSSTTSGPWALSAGISPTRSSMDDETHWAQPRRPSEDDPLRARPPLRTSKSSGLLSVMASQAHRIKKNAREAWPPGGVDDLEAPVATSVDDDDASWRGRSKLTRSDGTDLPAASPSSAHELSSTTKEPPKSDTPTRMYRSRRNKSQPTLRIVDDREFLEALEQVRMQHKERLANRERAKSSRKASMPNLRPSPSSTRRPPMPSSRGNSQHNITTADNTPLRSRASSTGSRAELEPLRLANVATPDIHTSTPDVSTSFLDLDSVGSESPTYVSDDDSSVPMPGASQMFSILSPTTSSTLLPVDSTHGENVDQVDGSEGHSLSSDHSEPIVNELGIGHTTGNAPSAPFTNDDAWKKEVKALFLIRELVQTERSYAAHLESLLIVVLKWTGTTSSTRLTTNVLMPTHPSSSSQSSASSLSTPLRAQTSAPVPPHLLTLRKMLPQLISVSRTLVYSIEESPTSEGVAQAFLSLRPRLEDVHMSWHAVVGSTLRALRITESSKSKSKGRLGRVPVAPTMVEPMRRPPRSDLSSSESTLDSERRDKSRAEPAPKELSAVDVAIMPTQRIPRYVLMLRDLLSHTSPDTAAFSALETALQSVQELGRMCDQASSRSQ
ncbi:guanyl-nucleotide exchange factor [Malassezia pachydermatis]